MRSNLLPSVDILKNLFSTIQDEAFKSVHRKKQENFTRQRVLDFSDLIMLQIKRIVLSLSVEVEKFLDLISCPLSYSKQAFSKARQQLSHSAFCSAVGILEMAIHSKLCLHFIKPFRHQPLVS